ncbi:hypothetical protein MUG12_03215 [Escherichia albertii NBRC 107761 = DSM 17582]|uniref:Uncharacterized protein n=1 Tax=Escherichia albertii (strain TW07627) TaxID=502347 RepID=A0ABC9NPF8_ESCAT|nr:hypothetical protein [Escherichia albertii]EDS92195.1 hypothetical protein ESCAB7627_0134 [Escherichia albertii TW07627]MCJ2195955.1 hypothetical protein [Escherichia albertii NBRC 107761 = DSM 17582]MCZ8798917.1 hypothetical protein [Escherichia albertii]GAL56003.1 hypothetical protein EA14781_155_00050 [Escherichia albertii NBRC 107761 = DSM 17582]
MPITNNTILCDYFPKNTLLEVNTEKTINKINQQRCSWEDTTGGNFIQFLIASEIQKKATGLTAFSTKAGEIDFYASLLNLRTNAGCSYRQCITPEYSDGSRIILDESEEGKISVSVLLYNEMVSGYMVDSAHPSYEMLHLFFPIAQQSQILRHLQEALKK